MLTADNDDPTSIEHPPVVRPYLSPTNGTRWLGPVPISRQTAETGLVAAAAVTLAAEAVRLVRKRRKRQGIPGTSPAEAPFTFEWMQITIERREMY